MNKEKKKNTKQKPPQLTDQDKVILMLNGTLEALEESQDQKGSWLDFEMGHNDEGQPVLVLLEGIFLCGFCARFSHGDYCQNVHCEHGGQLGIHEQIDKILAEGPGDDQEDLIQRDLDHDKITQHGQDLGAFEG